MKIGIEAGTGSEAGAQAEAEALNNGETFGK